MDQSTSQAVGRLVAHPRAPGFARVGEVEAGRIRLDFFESAADPIAESRWVPLNEVQRVRLSPQTRVFFQDGWRRWRAGRILGGGPDLYHVRLPNSDVDLQVAEDRLRVRWERPPLDPLQVMLTGANETPRYRDAREPVRRMLLAERAATASATGIASAGVRLHAHQISAALRIIRDPIQRYLLADEVGMGKTIQAGFVMRQVLIDVPGRRIGVIVPDALKAQWRAELLDKFYLDDFPLPDAKLPFEIVAHSETDRWDELEGVDMLVIDEAHLLARTDNPTDSPYRELAHLAHATPRLLMLSATPFSRSSSTHLALLNLLDPHLFRWENRKEFERLLDARREMALAVFGLDEEPDADDPALLQLQFDQISKIVPHDLTLAEAMDQAMQIYGPPGTDPETVDTIALRRAVAVVRTHVSETYRLHHRVIRNRRHVIEMQRLDDEGLLAPFEFAGRTRPVVLRLNSEEASTAAAAISDLLAGWATAVLDDGVDPHGYGRALGVLMSRSGGPARDLMAVLEYRVNGLDTEVLSTAEKGILDAAPALRFETDVLAGLQEVAGTDGLRSLAAAIRSKCKAPTKAIVFCGRGVLAADLAEHMTSASGTATRVYAHLGRQVEEQRDEATAKWHDSGGVLITDETGDVGRNFQDAGVVLHVRIPWDPNSLEQRIGRVDRYSDGRAAQQIAVADSDPQGLVTAWLKLLARGFTIFTESISAMQEAVDDLTGEVWATLLTEGVEGFLASSESVHTALAQEKRRINEVDALESSYGTHADGEAMTLAIAQYETHSAEIEQSYRFLIESAEGLRLASRKNLDGSIRFERNAQADPLVSGRLLKRLMTVEAARVGFFDRWKLTQRRRLFRRGNPFIDGIEDLLQWDDRGQAVAMWRMNPRQSEPLTFFGFDFLIEADLAPLLKILTSGRQAEAVARRRADAAFVPQHHRVWVPINTTIPVGAPDLEKYLSQPFKEGRDANLNLQRILALHTLLGGQENVEPVARACLTAAREHVKVISGVGQASKQAADKARAETEYVVAQNRARSQAAALLSDPTTLEAEVALGRAIEAAVLTPLVRLATVSCVVVSAQPWADYVER